MTKFQVLGVTALALLTLARDATAQRGGAVRSGARGAVVGGLVGGESGAATGAKIGVVTGAARSVGQEAQARAQYQTTAAYQSAPRSDFNQAPPAVLGDVLRWQVAVVVDDRLIGRERVVEAAGGFRAQQEIRRDECHRRSLR